MPESVPETIKMLSRKQSKQSMNS